MPSRRWKIIATVFGLLIVALLSINFFASMYATKKLVAAFSKNQQYAFHFENLRLNIFTGSARAKNVHVSPISSSSNDTIQRVNFTTTSINLSGIHWYSLLFKKNICIGEIQLEHPVLAVRNLQAAKKKRNYPKTSFSLYHLIHPEFESLRINKFEVSDGKISAAGKDSSHFYFASNSISFELNDFFADSAITHAGKVFEIRNAAASFKNVHGFFTRGLYRVAIPTFTFSTKDSMIDIDSLFFSPTADKTQFAKKLGYQKAYRDIMLAGVRVHSGKFLRIIDQQQVLIDAIEISYARIYNYKDKSLPVKSAKYVLHHTFLDSLPFKIDLEKVKVNDGKVAYDLLAAGATEPGHVDFDSIRFTLSNFSNVNMNDTMRADISASGMSQAALRIHLVLPLARDEFYTSGTLGPHELPIWNSILTNYKTPMQIKTGRAKSATFSFTANATKGTGTMTFIYSDLKVNTLNSQHETGGVKNAVKTFVANRIIIDEDNPHHDVLRIGKIDFPRNPERNFISYVYHMIFDGMESSVGLKEEKMKKEILKSH